MKVLGNAIRPGMVLQYKDKLVLVVKIELRTPGNLRAFNQVEMQDVVTPSFLRRANSRPNRRSTR